MTCFVLKDGAEVMLCLFWGLQKPYTPLTFLRILEVSYAQAQTGLGTMTHGPGNPTCPSRQQATEQACEWAHPGLLSHLSRWLDHEQPAKIRRAMQLTKFSGLIMRMCCWVIIPWDSRCPAMTYIATILTLTHQLHRDITHRHHSTSISPINQL